MSNLQCRGPGVPDPLPVYRSDADDSSVEQLGALRIRGLDDPLDTRGLGKSELQDHFRVWCAARCCRTTLESGVLPVVEASILNTKQRLFVSITSESSDHMVVETGRLNNMRPAASPSPTAAPSAPTQSRIVGRHYFRACARWWIPPRLHWREPR